MSLFDGPLWIVAVAGVLVVALVAKWLRGAAVEDPHEELRDANVDAPTFAAEEDELVEAVDEADDAAEDEDDEEDDEEVEEEEIGEDELAPLGVSPDDRLEFLERLAEGGAIALLWTRRDDPKASPLFVQHRNPDGTSLLPVFTSGKKAYGYPRMRRPEARAITASIEAMPVDAAFLLQGEFEVVVNPETPFETTLTAEDRTTLAALAGVEEREADEATFTEEEFAELAARHGKESTPSDS